MKRNALWSMGVLVAFGVTVGAYPITRGPAGSDCPGRIVCPITGEETCKDQCPLIDASRSDCPGKIPCPLSGEVVCRDQCPLGKAADALTEARTDTSACCLAQE